MSRYLTSVKRVEELSAPLFELLKRDYACTSMNHDGRWLDFKFQYRDAPEAAISDVIVFLRKYPGVFSIGTRADPNKKTLHVKVGV